MKDITRNIIEISSGIGNQMFQYAFGYGLYKRTQMEMILDPVYVNDFRKFSLDRYPLDFSDRLISGFKDYFLGRGPRKDQVACREYRDRLMDSQRIKTIRETPEYEYRFAPELFARERACYRGYWQNWRYFDEWYDDIKRQFTYHHSFSDSGLEYQERIAASKVSVSLHIRRTDYVTCDATHWVIDEDYYRRALRYMEEQVGPFDLFIFSDDREYVKDRFRFHEFVLVDGTSDLEDLALMSACHHHILANSSFSWWGAYLGENKGGTVVAPVVHHWTPEFYLPNWHLIEV